MYQTLSAERDGDVALLTLQRSSRRNAMSAQMGEEFAECLEELASVRALVVTGDERAFSAGADTSEAPSERPRRAANWGLALDRLAHADFVSVAAIEGYCLGGGLELALACDLRVAAETSLLGTPEIRHGLFPAGGGTQRLGILVGTARARQLLLLGEPITGTQAASWGIVNASVEPGAALRTARQWADIIANRDPQAVREIKYLTAWSDEAILSRGLQLERERLRALLSNRPATPQGSSSSEEAEFA